MPYVRANVMLTDEQHRWLSAQRKRDHLSASLRIRSLIELMREDETLSARVLKKASEMLEDDEQRL